MEKEKDEMEANMQHHLKNTSDFLKEAFGVDGEVKTDAKECTVVEQDGRHTFGITFVLTDSKRGEFMVTLSNPKAEKSK
jgi:hypothetical protein